MDIVVILAVIFIGVLLLKSAAGIFKFLIKVAIYAAIGYGVYKALIYFGMFHQ